MMLASNILEKENYSFSLPNPHTLPFNPRPCLYKRPSLRRQVSILLALPVLFPEFDAAKETCIRAKDERLP
jgi:hypothetical protein